jgi:hypothetical protein
MNVVEGEKMEEVVRGSVFPRFMERASLGCEDRLWEQDAFLEMVLRMRFK